MSLEVRHISYIYNQGTAMEKPAVSDISFQIEEGSFVGVIGQTGSGKSTLIQHLNGLLTPTSGEVCYQGKVIGQNGFSMKDLRREVGLVFQYPEHQLFEETVLLDVCFGPKNQGLSKEECEERAREAMRLTGVPEELFDKSPFELSGGQKRRVAIAGVLAMHPRFLILDEPTAGLDPGGRSEILGQIRELHRETGMGVVLVSHSMEDVAEYVERILVINEGKLYLDGTPREVFAHADELSAIGLSVPQVTEVLHKLKERGIEVDENLTRISDAAGAILSAFAQKGGERP